MEITTTKTDLIEKITAQYQPYIQAMRTPDLKSQAPIDNYKSIYKSVLLAIEYTGSLKNEEDNANKFLTENLLKELLVKYPYIRHGEIELALKKGALKEYGDYFGINMQTLYGWIKKYMNSQELLAAKREWVDLIEAPISDKPLAKIFELTDKQLLDLFKEFKEGNPLPVYSRIYYQEICKRKGVKTLIESSVIRDEIRKNARIEYEQSLKERKLHTKEPETFKLLLAQFTNSNKTYQSISQRIALQSYFSDLIKQNKELEL